MKTILAQINAFDSAYLSVTEIFAQEKEISLPAKNTAVSGLESPFYNMRVAMHKI